VVGICYVRQIARDCVRRITYVSQSLNRCDVFLRLRFVVRRKPTNSEISFRLANFLKESRRLSLEGNNGQGGKGKRQLITQSYIPRAMMRRVDGEESILGDRTHGVKITLRSGGE
jgi:hypothetical protein